MQKLDLSEDVAGATFMAAGSSAPELFASIIGKYTHPCTSNFVRTFYRHNLLPWHNITAKPPTIALTWQPYNQVLTLSPLKLCGPAEMSLCPKHVLTLLVEWARTHTVSSDIDELLSVCRCLHHPRWCWGRNHCRISCVQHPLHHWRVWNLCWTGVCVCVEKYC